MGVPNLRPLAGYSGSSFKTGGCFAVTDKTEISYLHAGSYTGYNRWRADLAERFNPYRTGVENAVEVALPPTPEGPFYELIWFADNEGVIAELAAAKLLGDFRAHRVEYMAAHAGTDSVAEFHRRRYDGWLRCFELAADGGLVDFH